MHVIVNANEHIFTAARDVEVHDDYIQDPGDAILENIEDSLEHFAGTERWPEAKERIIAAINELEEVYK